MSARRILAPASISCILLLPQYLTAHDDWGLIDNSVSEPEPYDEALDKDAYVETFYLSSGIAINPQLIIPLPESI